MSEKVWTVRRFLFSEYFADGVRITIGVILPVLAFSLMGHMQQGLPVAMGALLGSLSDAPGPVKHKRNGMLLCILTVFVVALITGFARQHVVVMGLEVLLFSFLFSMMTVYGNRAILIGTAGLLIMILVMGIGPANTLLFSALVVVGGFWYLLLSMLFSSLLPYRPAQHALGECIRETASFLRLRAAFYMPDTDLNENFNKVILQQRVVSEKQDAVRELLLRTRQQVKESTDQSRVLVLTFVDVVDLYEQISAIHFNYESMRQLIGTTGLPEQIGSFVQHVAQELNEVGWAIQTNASFRARYNLEQEMEQLKRKLEQVQETLSGEKRLVLDRVMLNLNTLMERFLHISAYFGERQLPASMPGQEMEYSKFVTSQEYDAKRFLDNLTLESSVFRYALRVAIACGFGYALTIAFSLGHHSYWVLLTIIVILKPAFSLTKQRNYQRLVGTVTGGVLGVAVLGFVKDPFLLLALLVVCMLGTFSFQRLNYIVSVTFMTPFILIAFGFMGGGTSATIAQERIIDTLIGSLIALVASHTLFPDWESYKVRVFLVSMLQANIAYLQKLADTLAGKEVPTIEYKLARKDVYVSSANLSAAFQRMISEPKRKQRNVEAIHGFLVLNHILSSNIAALASLLQASQQPFSKEFAAPLYESVNLLQLSLQRLDTKDDAQETVVATAALPSNSQDEVLLKEQISFMQKVCVDIHKASAAILA